MNIVVANTKGGAGKTTVALNVLPLLLNQVANKEIAYYQLDDNNQIITNSDKVEIKSYKIDKANEVVDEIMLENLTNPDKINIIDCGGGNDTKIVIKNLAENGIEDNIFIVPTNQNLSVRHNIIDTINLIKDNFDNPVIILVANNVFDISNIKKEFLSIFGDKDFNIEPLNLKELGIKDIGIVPFLPFLQIVEAKKEILLDKYLEAKDILKDEKNATKKFAEKLDKQLKEGSISKDEMKLKFSEFRDLVRNAKRVVNASEKIIEANKDILKFLKG
jgi:cellulose biosynthesis protein BcsQ